MRGSSLAGDQAGIEIGIERFRTAFGSVAGIPSSAERDFGERKAIVIDAHHSGHDLVAAFHETGRHVDAYTIRRADAEGLATARRLLALRVDQITTDDPEGLGAALG